MSSWTQAALAGACAAGLSASAIPGAMAQTIVAAQLEPDSTVSLPRAPVAPTTPVPAAPSKPTAVEPTPAPVAAVAHAPAISAASAPEASVSGFSASTYRINPGDEVEIYVWGEERLQRTVRVLPDGTIAFPLAGQIKVQGMLPHDLELTVSERLRDQYRGQVPQVTVSIKSPAGLQYSVMGKVKSPGTYSPGRYTNLLEALSLAGGPAEFANLDGVVILRKQGTRTITLRYRLGSLLKSGEGGAEATQARIEPGDMIIVP